MRKPLAGTDSNRAEAVERMIYTYGDSIWRLCLSMLGDRSSAEDAFQETWLKVWRNYGSFRGVSSERTWIVHIAMNVCRDMFRTPWFRIFRRAAGEEAL